VSGCLSVAEFVELLGGDDARQAHVAICARCRAILRAVSTSRGLDDLETAIEEIERRRQDAAAAVADLESTLPHRWPLIARSDPRLHGPEGVRRLLGAASACSGTTPRRALALAQAALLSCHVGDVEAAVRFDVLKDVARYSLQGADDLNAAVDALAQAEQLVPLTEDPAYFTAILSYARACVWGDATCGRWDEALRELDRCDEVLRRSDVVRWRGARHLRAVVLVRCGNYKAASVLFEELLSTTSDEYARALLSGDLANCYCWMGYPDEAIVLLDHALPAFLKRAEMVRWARAMWVRGEALAALGDYEDSIRVLTVTSRFFASVGLGDDELGVEILLLRILRTKDPSADLISRLEQAYVVALALDTEQPFRSGARRAAVWAELCSAYRDGTLTVDTLAGAGERLRRDVEAQNLRPALG